MIIYKLPVTTYIKCKCGCEFEFNCADLNVDVMVSPSFEEISRVSVNCPFCKFAHILKDFKDKGENK